MSYQLFIWVTIEWWAPKLTAIFSNKSVYSRAEVGLTSVWVAGLQSTYGLLIWFNSNWYKTFNLLTTCPTIRVVLTVLNSPLINWVMISMPIESKQGLRCRLQWWRNLIHYSINYLKQVLCITSILRAVKLTSNVTAYKQIITIIWETHTSNALQVVHQFHA